MTNGRPEPAQQRASVTAQIDAALRGTERGLLVLGVLFLLLFLGSLSSMLLQPTWAGYAGAGTGLLGLSCLLIQWWRMGERAYHHDAPSTSLAVSNELVRITTPLITLQEKVTLVREIIHNRKPLPPPHGAAEGREPRDADKLRAYSNDERKRIAQELQEGLKRHDAQLVQDLQKIAPSLPQQSSVESVPGAVDQSPPEDIKGGRQASPP